MMCNTRKKNRHVRGNIRGVFLLCATTLSFHQACADENLTEVDNTLAPPAGFLKANGISVNSELRLRLDTNQLNLDGPAAQANAIQPGSVSTNPNTQMAQLELTVKSKWVNADLVLQLDHQLGGSTLAQGVVNELYVPLDLGSWQATAGKQVVSWDVGYGFRPNDLVQHENRLSTLLTVPLEGRPLIQLEHYDANTTASIVWVNPKHANEKIDANMAEESALIGRWYARTGAVDQYYFARLGRNTDAGVGASMAWVASDTLELHGSAFYTDHYIGWMTDSAATNNLLNSSPWNVGIKGSATQALLGLSWTGEQKQSILFEYWYDGTALSDADWNRWNTRNAALAQLNQQVPAQYQSALAGNLAWQALPTNVSNLRQQNLLLRTAYETGNWKFSLDSLYTPTDHGYVLTPALQWQGQQLRVNFAYRWFGGNQDAIYRQLPYRSNGLLSLSYFY